jgi:serine protein kinase
MLDQREEPTQKLTVSGHEILDDIATGIFKRFQDKEQIKSFGDFLTAVREAPWLHTRSSAQYIKDTFDYFGSYEVWGMGGKIRRFRLFDMEFAPDDNPIYGQESVQNQIYAHLSSFAERGVTDKIIVLHGPNGTGKTSLITAIMRAMEHYSHQPEGVLYTFNWIFSDNAERTSLGFDNKISIEPGESLAYVDAKDISFKIRCHLRDNPLLILPPKERREFLEAAFAKHDRPMHLNRILSHGNISHKSREIYNELLSSYHGDWIRVLQHVQVSRYYVSKRYRRGAVTIEPQRNIDASARPLTMEKSFQIPTILQQANLHDVFGDLVDGNRGLIEYSDFFKRPMEVNKYLLTTSEQGTISLSSTMAYLDVVLISTSNEKHLSIFRADPDFSSFKARMELVKVPYLLQWQKETALFQQKIQSMARGKPLGPHVCRLLGLWATLTRLRRPNPDKYKEPLAKLVKELGAIEKANLYDSGKPPPRLRDSDRQELIAGLSQIAAEYDEVEDKFEGLFGPEYEGRRGVSVREMLTLINDAALSNDYQCLSGLAVLDAIDEFVKDKSLYDFLRLDTQKTYGEMTKLTKDVEKEYRSWVTEDIRNSTALISDNEYERLFNDYFIHVKAWKNNEKVLNERTGALEEASLKIMQEVESVLGVTEKEGDYRSGMIMRIASWALENRGEKIRYKEIFKDLFDALKAAYYRSQASTIATIHHNILKYGTDEWVHVLPKEQKAVEQTLKTLDDQYGYSEVCAKEIVSYILNTEKIETPKP